MTKQHKPLSLASDGYVVVGKLGRVNGIQGFIHVQVYSGDVEQLLSYPQWYGNIKNEWVPLQRAAEKIDPQNRLFVKIGGSDTREEAALLTHTLIAIPEDQLPSLSADEFYCFELIGMEVFNTDGVQLGTVSQLLETGANDVLVVTGDKRLLIPYLPGRVVQSVSREQRQIVVDWDGDFL